MNGQVRRGIEWWSWIDDCYNTLWKTKLYNTNILREFYDKCWWKIVPGTIVEVKWPRGWVLLHEMPDGSRTETNSADPNDHYRPYLEKYVGKQGIDWNWKIGNFENDSLFIKLRKGKEQYASFIAMKWG
jgi:hypothetical protein